MRHNPHLDPEYRYWTPIRFTPATPIAERARRLSAYVDIGEGGCLACGFVAYIGRFRSTCPNCDTAITEGYVLDGRTVPLWPAVDARREVA